MKHRSWLQVLTLLYALSLFAFALWTLHHILAEYRYHDVVAAIHTVTGWQITLAVLLTLLSYLVLTGYDLLALRYLKQSLSWPWQVFYWPLTHRHCRPICEPISIRAYSV